MNKTIIAIPDQHAHPEHDNKRADYLSRLIIDRSPYAVVNIGDAADMSSLSAYDKGKRSFYGRSYRADINAHLDFQSRLWDPVKARKKKLPHRVILEGNHEHRVERALDLSPELAGTIGFSDFDFDSYYDEVVRYDGSTPGVYELDDILFAHYFISGVSGRPVSGASPARMLLDKVKQSCVQGHVHTFDYSVHTNVNHKTTSGLVIGCYQDYDNDWAGNISHLWRRGVAVMNNVSNGDYDLEWISLAALEKEYG